MRAATAAAGVARVERGGGGDHDAKLVELRNRGDAPMGGRDAEGLEGGHKDEVRGRRAARHSMNEYD